MSGDVNAVRTVVVFEREDEATFRFGDAEPIQPPAALAAAFDEAAPALGDRMTMTVPLRFGTADGDVPATGSFELHAVVTAPGRTLRESRFLCTGVVLLPDGALFKQAVWSPSVFADGRVGARIAGPITGGSGAYGGAAGEWRLIGVSKNVGKLVYRFTTMSGLWDGAE